jgi:hypothetical protein
MEVLMAVMVVVPVKEVHGEEERLGEEIAALGGFDYPVDGERAHLLGQLALLSLPQVVARRPVHQLRVVVIAAVTHSVSEGERHTLISRAG